MIFFKGKTQWERSLKEYIQIPETLRTFQVDAVGDVPQLIPCSIYPRRRELYLDILNKVPPHNRKTLNIAHHQNWCANISYRGESVEIPIHIPENVANIANSTNRISFQRTRHNNNPPVTVSLEQLQQEAEEMDRKLAENEQEAENFGDRLSNVIWQLYDENSDDFQTGEELVLERLIHIVGLLNVGKTTLLLVLIYFLAKKGRRCALIVNDVVATVRLASLFRFGLEIEAVPILGNNRSEHLQKVYEPILFKEGEDIFAGASHPAWRWFSDICPLISLVKAEEKWGFGNEPCHQLYQKIHIAKNREKAPEDDDFEDTDKYTCPLYFNCPRHQLEKDITTAKIWILTPASLIHTKVPKQVFLERNIRSCNLNYPTIRFAEAVYYQCDFLFVDEADRVQIQFDKHFAPDEVLLDNSANSFLNKLGKIVDPLYNSNRISMTANLFKIWTNSQYDAQKAVNLICPLLYDNEDLVNWLGSNTFTATSIFVRIFTDLSQSRERQNNTTKKESSRERERRILQGLLSEEQRIRKQEIIDSLQEFIRDPLNQRQGVNLANIALSAFNSDDLDEVLEDIEKWLLEWLINNQITRPEKEQLKKTKSQIYFAIIVAVLDKKLGFLVDNLPEIRQFIDSHDLSQWLVKRPPNDYLPVIPSAPVGNILGFQYTRDRNNRGGKLQYFRYVGIGRTLLLNFPTLWAVDNWQGPHTILISGTSYAPGSPAYHITEKPTVLLEPNPNNNRVGDAGIRDSKFYFSAQQWDGKNIAISGLKPDRRKAAGLNMVKAISSSRRNDNNFLDRVFEEIKNLAEKNPDLWKDRQRLLIITNSYDEAEWITDGLKSRNENIQALIRDNAPEDMTGIPRGKIKDLKDIDPAVKILVAPLMALERGHNILNDNRIAAFGAALFVPRPMPVPDDWQNVVQQLNNWGLEKERDRTLYNIEDNLTVDRIGDIFYTRAKVKMLELNCRAFSYQQLTPEERSVLCWTQLVSIWQIIGRLVRGGVPCIVHFLDVKFAPLSAKEESDTETTSLLIGIIKQLENALEADNLLPYKRTLPTSLYETFYNALQNTEGLNYD